jgi:hypothetical protein
VIRQAISCDICGSEKRQTNHWFVAYEQAGELRISGWTSRHRLRSDSKHLCGQTCLHKLVDEFMAKSIASRAKPLIAEHDSTMDSAIPSGAALVAPPANIELESSARLLKPAHSAPPQPIVRPKPPKPEMLEIPSRPQLDDFVPLSGDTPSYVSPDWHAKAWERERARELRAIENRAGNSARHRSDA